MNNQYNKTVYACFIGYIVQAIVNNFAPLLFLTFQTQYSIPLSQVTVLITVNFIVQLLVDLAAVAFVDKLGYRSCVVAAHIFASAGLLLLAVLPGEMQSPFTGLLISVIVYAIGGGLLEVLISPIVEACPTDNKEKAMSMLHSFYCWGTVGVIGLSTVFFSISGIHNWPLLAVIWAVVPAVNAVVFSKVPIANLISEGEQGLPLKNLLHFKVFWFFVILMICAGASEQAVSQWASTLAEKGLGIQKTSGDLAGPLMFSLLMGISRAVYGKLGDKINLQRFMLFSGILCISSYLLISLSPFPILGLVGCAVCGMSVGIMWPGAFSMASSSIKNGGTAMFALLALAGDLGCSAGPSVVGFISGMFGDRLQAGILAALVFPLCLVCLLVYFLVKRNKPKEKNSVTA